MRSGSDPGFGRERAVRRAAEFLRETEAPFFPLDAGRLAGVFRGQVFLTEYAALREPEAIRSAGLRMNPEAVSRDGFCVRIGDALIRPGAEPVAGSLWRIFYERNGLEARVRFTLMHEMGHILLGHHQQLNTDALEGPGSDPRYAAADAQADAFSINALAPAPAVRRLLRKHGIFRDGDPAPETEEADAAFLRDLGTTPDPEVLLKTAFGLSGTAARRRLEELPADLAIWKGLDPDLWRTAESIPHRSGWYCSVCRTRRRSASLYCPGCGTHHSYEYRDFGKFSPPAAGLRENGQFAFCSVCGNTRYPEDAVYCPVCGCPVVNECENALMTDGEFIRSGMWIVRGTHRCRPTDIYCGECGALTAFGRRHGPRENLWTQFSGNRGRRRGTEYPPAAGSGEGEAAACPACGSTRSLRGGRFCADCGMPLQNCCTAGGKKAHACGPEDRYCPACGSPTLFFRAGILPDYAGSETFRRLLEAERQPGREAPPRLVILNDGSVRRAPSAGETE